MNRLRKDRVIVDLAKEEGEKKDAYDQTKGGIYVPEDKKKAAFLTKGVVLQTGTDVHPKDISAGTVVYVKKLQGERLSPEAEEYLFLERDIIGND
jgi:co-chaperonin GroES (HSP10)